MDATWRKQKQQVRSMEGRKEELQKSIEQYEKEREEIKGDFEQIKAECIE